MITVELSAAIDAAGTVKTLYFATNGFATQSTDTPANTFFDPRLQDPATIGIHVFSDGKTGGKSALETGELILANNDGVLDYILDYSVDGRDITIRQGTDGAAYPTAYITIFNGTMEAIEADFKKIIIRLRDKSYLLDAPLSTNKYLGNNALPAGLEGTQNDLKTTRKPIIYGDVFNYSILQVNTSRMIYQCSDGAVLDVPAVYDLGVSLTKGANYISQADMEANAPALGEYRAWIGGGYVRLGSKPAGLVTADITQTIKTTASIMEQIAHHAGITNISAADVSSLNAANNSSVGLVVQSQTALEALDTIASSIGAYFYFDKTGMFRMGQLTAPSVTAQSSFYEYEILSIERRPSKDINIPAFSVSIDYANNETVQTNAAGSVSTSRVAWLSKKSRSVQSVDAAIKNQYLLARDVKFTTRLISQTSANNEAVRRLNLYKTKRDVYDVKIPSSLSNNSLMDAILIFSNRFNLASGKNFRLIGQSLNAKDKTMMMTLWG